MNMTKKSFELDPWLPVKQSVFEVARSQLGKAIRALNEHEDDPAEAIHDFRKATKKVRALLRLVRDDSKKAYSKHNAALRDAARLLSPLRDRDALIETLDALGELQLKEEESALSRVRQQLLEERENSPSPDHLKELIPQVRAQVETTLGELDKVHVRSGSTLMKGMQRTYKCARKRYEAALGRETEKLHELRKRVKTHRYHLRLFRGNYREVLNAERKVAKKASDLLGDDRDLALLEDRVAELSLSKADRKLALRTISRRRLHLQDQAFELCARLLVEKPKRRRRRIDAYLRAGAQAGANSTEPS